MVPPAPRSNLVVVAALFLLGCSSSNPGASANQVPSVTMTDTNQFVPATITIQRGTTLVWSNTGGLPHTVTDDLSKAMNKGDAILPDGTQPWDSGIITGGQTYSRTFDVPGQYSYFCVPHEALGMVGRITVNG
jgi:plastocyanin